MRWLLASAAGAGVAAAAYWRQALSLDGAVAAAAVGALTFGRGGGRAAAALLAFFVSSSALGRLHRAHVQAKGARRDAWQVLANGGTASLALALGSENGFVGGLAAAAADTWATEVGLRAGHQPRLITTGQVVEPGRSGGVTLPGLVASVGGAVTVTLAWRLAGGDARPVGALVIAGCAGSLVDSLLGATWQALYRCTTCERLTEQTRCHAAPTHLVHGQPWITNDAVNALATLAGTCLGAAAGRVRAG